MFTKKSPSISSTSDQLKAGVVAVAAVATAGWLSYRLAKSSKGINTRVIKAIKEYSQKKYGDLGLTTAELDQLSFLQKNSTSTCEGSVKLKGKPVELHIEIKRALGRLHALLLLEQGDEVAYQRFTGDQTTHKLDFESFRRLGRRIDALFPAEFKALRASCFITMSDTAKQLAKRFGIKFSSDSEKFVTDIVEQCPTIFPAAEALDKESRKLLSVAFLRDTHGRHMLYTEGNEQMFSELRKRIDSYSLSIYEFELWLNRWIINIAGFRAHLDDPAQASYLTQQTADSIFALKKSLDPLWKRSDSSSKHDILGSYLLERAKWMNLGDNLYLAHLACMLRQFTPAEGEALKAWFNILPLEEQTARVENYNKVRLAHHVTSTYEPAVLDNLGALEPKPSLEVILEIYEQVQRAARKVYIEKINNGEIDKNTPLSFRNIAFKAKELLDQFQKVGHIPSLDVNAEGDILMSQVRLRSTLSL